MDALILSCSTGGGHNSAGRAIKEELESRGHNVTMIDPYRLVSDRLEHSVGNGYVKIAQKTPLFFGFIYKLGDYYRRLPIHSPVYEVNKGMLNKMQCFLEQHHFDVIIMPHVYPGEILTYMKDKGLTIPKLIFVATDYTCIPFTEETDCDYYIVPCKELESDFTQWNISPDKLVPAGIPVKKCFRNTLTKEEAKRALGLSQRRKYLLLSGGSIGAGSIKKAVSILTEYLRLHQDYHLIVICGNNQKLYRSLQSKYKKHTHITVLASTDQMALYMRASEAYLTKPGGLSSTEAAVAHTPLIHIAPIPGCETKNMKFFAQSGMCIPVGNNLSRLPKALEQISDPKTVARMLQRQAEVIAPDSATKICDLAEQLATSDKN